MACGNTPGNTAPRRQDNSRKPSTRTSPRTLLSLYAEDSPRNMRYLTPKDLKDAGIDRNELRASGV